MSKIKDLFNDDKPREQAKLKGIESLTNASLLALIINNGVKGISCIDIANEILKHVKNISSLIDITFNDLINIKGLNEAKIFRILAVIELEKRILYSKNLVLNKKIYDPLELVNEFMFYHQYDENAFLILYKDNKRIRTINFSSYSKEFIKLSLNSIINQIKTVNANKVILIHNHLEDEDNPSSDDIFTTISLEEKMNKCAIIFYDHIIVSRNGYFSFKEAKIL